MLDFNKYLMRHGESWIQDVIEQQEKFKGLRASSNVTLEERWDFIMNLIPTAQNAYAAA